MTVKYNSNSDTLTIRFSDVRIKESDEIKPGVIVDYGYDDQINRLVYELYELTEEEIRIVEGEK